MIENTDRNLFWDVIDDLLTLAMIIGVISTLCFFLGYFWYAP